MENSFKTVAGKNMWCHHGQKYGHTQGTPRETNEIRKPDTLVHEQHPEPRLSVLNMTTSASAGVIVGFEDFISPGLASQF